LAVASVTTGDLALRERCFNGFASYVWNMRTFDVGLGGMEGKLG